ncbi:MAG: hypothetical protein DCC64_15885 [Planctomycetota bacterium]|nr:MAG: hypothetical protein DCC64_15885 [Planctomycetota bacterium]
MKNFHKAESGAVIFQGYAAQRFTRCYDQMPCVIAALLTDLMHFAHAQGVEFEGCVEIARQRYDEDNGFVRGAP